MAHAIKGSPLLIDDSFDLTVNGFISRCREEVKETPIRIVFLDSWDHLHFSSKPDEKEIVEIFRKIKSLACELGLTIVINMKLSQEIEEEYRWHHLPEIYDFVIPEEALDETAGSMALYRSSYYRILHIRNLKAYERTFQDEVSVFVFRSRVSKTAAARLVFSLYNKRLDHIALKEPYTDAWYLEDCISFRERIRVRNLHVDYSDMAITIQLLYEDGDFGHAHISPLHLERIEPNKDEAWYELARCGQGLIMGSVYIGYFTHCWEKYKEHLAWTKKD